MGSHQTTILKIDSCTSALGSVLLFRVYSKLHQDLNLNWMDCYCNSGEIMHRQNWGMILEWRLYFAAKARRKRYGDGKLQEYKIELKPEHGHGPNSRILTQ